MGAIPLIVIFVVGQQGLTSGRSLVRGILVVLDNEPDMEVVGEAANGVAAIEAAVELRAGAVGFLLKDVEPADLLAGIRTTMRGDALVAPAATRSLVDHALQQRVDVPGGVDGAVLDELSDREREVLVQRARALSNAQVADALFLGETSVKSHVSNLLSERHLRSRVQAVVLAHETGLVNRGQVGYDQLLDGA